MGTVYKSTVVCSTQAFAVVRQRHRFGLCECDIKTSAQPEAAAVTNTLDLVVLEGTKARRQSLVASSPQWDSRGELQWQGGCVLGPESPCGPGAPAAGGGGACVNCA